MILHTAKASKKKWKNKWKGFSIMGLDIKWTATAQQASNSVNQSQSSELLIQHSQGQKCEWQKQAYVFLPINDSNKNNKVSDKLKRNCFCHSHRVTTQPGSSAGKRWCANNYWF